MFDAVPHDIRRYGNLAAWSDALEGLEARFNGECAVLKNYRTFKQMVMHCRQRELPPAFYFEPYKAVICPRIDDAP